MRFGRRLLLASVLALLPAGPPRPARPGWVARYCRPFPGHDGVLVWRPDSAAELAEMLRDDLDGVVGLHERLVGMALSRLAA